jgi:hypothetical protein
MKLCVAGCSFSDRTKVEYSYGDYLAKRLNTEYIHEGAGCGSNYRIWRKIVGHVLDKTLTNEDIVIIQYTNLERREFYSSNPPVNRVFEIGDIQIQENYDNGSVIRYKLDSHVWQDFDDDKKFFKLYQDGHINFNYDSELFGINNAMFQSFLEQNKMRVIFIDGRYIKVNRVELNLSNYFKSMSFIEPESFVNVIDARLDPDDIGHLSTSGHMSLANMLYDHIHNLKWI